MGNEQQISKIEFHIPVMKEIVRKLFEPIKNGFLVDGTIGTGGHALEILKISPESLKIVGFDKDKKSLAIAEQRLKEFRDRVYLLNKGFENILENLNGLKIKKVMGILLDLGLNSFQLSEFHKGGFSFQYDDPVDMRYDTENGVPVIKFIEKSSAKELSHILSRYGEVKNSPLIAKIIKKDVQNGSIKTASDLRKCIEKIYLKRKYGRIHPATKVFLALRMFINQEIECLKKFLNDFPLIVDKNGRVVIISYNSLECRCIKNKFNELKRNEKFKILTKKVIKPTREEIYNNPRARSAKLRAIEVN